MTIQNTLASGNFSTGSVLNSWIARYNKAMMDAGPSISQIKPAAFLIVFMVLVRLMVKSSKIEKLWGKWSRNAK